MMTTQQLVDLINDNYDAYDCFGVRAHNQAVAQGTVLGPSWSSVDGEAAFQLPGTCCIRISAVGSDAKVAASVESALRTIKRYCDSTTTLVLIASKQSAGMDVDRNDPNEEILVDPVVLAVLS